MNKITLVLITTSFPIANDGSEAAGSFVADLVDELAKYINVRVVAPGLEARREQLSESVEVYRYSAPSQPLSTLKPWRFNDLRWGVKVLSGGLQATREASIGGADHIFALWGLPSGEWARKVAEETGLDYSVWMLGSDVWSLGRIPIFRGMLARVIRHAKNAYADGYKLAKDAECIAGVPVEFLPSTRRIDSINTKPPQSHPPYRLLFLGRWHLNKGTDLLLDALTMLSDDDWLCIDKVEVQGGGPLGLLVNERIAVFQQEGRPVELGGFLAKHEAEAAIARADWVMIPSRIESIPVIFSDAMKLGRPVISMPVGDLPALFEQEEYGVLAEEVNAIAYCQAIRRALACSTVYFSDGIKEHSACFDLGGLARTLVKKMVGHA
ncbi:MAG: glycosyltransferase [Spongiibacteraceae bacterium]